MEPFWLVNLAWRFVPSFWRWGSIISRKDRKIRRDRVRASNVFRGVQGLVFDNCAVCRFADQFVVNRVKILDPFFVPVVVFQILEKWFGVIGTSAAGAQKDLNLYLEQIGKIEQAEMVRPCKVGGFAILPVFKIVTSSLF